MEADTIIATVVKKGKLANIDIYKKLSAFKLFKEKGDKYATAIFPEYSEFFEENKEKKYEQLENELAG